MPHSLPSLVLQMDNICDMAFHIVRHGGPKLHHLASGRFCNPWPSAGTPHGFWDIVALMKDTHFREMYRVPTKEECVDSVPLEPSSQYSVTWLGHASFLISWNALRIVTDPVFSQRCSPFSFMGPKRYTQPPCAVKDILPVDIVLISHCHYDHLDLDTLKQIGNDPLYVVPLNTASLLHGVGIHNVIEMDWHDTLTVANTTIHCKPAQHGTARGLFDRDAYLWCSYVIQSGDRTAYFAGDTGYRRVGTDTEDVSEMPYNPTFEEIGRQFGAIDVAMLPIGAYSPRHFMSLVHADPVDAVCMFKDLKAKHMIPMHYGTFRLTDELPMAPLDMAKKALKDMGYPLDVLHTLAIGGTFQLE